VPGIARHYIRINPVADPFNSTGHEDPDQGILTLANQRPGDRYQYPAKDIVDGGFLELVRFGIRRPDDPLIVQSLKVIDAVLKVDTPGGPCWKRYNHDGYGQRDDGGPFDGWGVGRPWPLLTLERATYELSAGRDIAVYRKAIQNFSTGIGLIPEQIWDAPDLPKAYLNFGKATGSANPLMWAHAEYVKLLRSVADGKLFDVIDAVVTRYCNDRPRPDIEIWKMNHQVKTVPSGCLLRILAVAPFSLHWSDDGWTTKRDTSSIPTSLGIEYVDIQVAKTQSAPIRFTFYWPQESRWQGADFAVQVL
jgi:glucoamylase